MNAIWVWQVMEEGEWSAIAAIMPHISDQPVPLFTRNENMARVMFAPLAELHQVATGLPVRLARYELAEVEDTL